MGKIQNATPAVALSKMIIMRDQEDNEKLEALYASMLKELKELKSNEKLIDRMDE